MYTYDHLIHVFQGSLKKIHTKQWQEFVTSIFVKQQIRKHNIMYIPGRKVILNVISYIRILFLGNLDQRNKILGM